MGTPEKWANLQTEICSHDNVLNTPAVTGLMIKCNKKVWDSGLTKYVLLGVHKLMPNTSDLLRKKSDNFKSKVEWMVKTKKFDLILTIRDKKHKIFWDQRYIPLSLVLKNYNRIDTVQLRLGYQQYKIELWKPK